MMSAQVTEKAKSILRSQPFIPLSPAALDPAGSLCLCGAAALAAAGYELLLGEEAAQKFRADLRGNKPRCLESAFVRLEWDILACESVRVKNDAAAANDRLAVLDKALDSLVGHG